MQSSVEYDPDAQCDRWLRFLREIFLSDQDLIDFIQRAIGYSISGHTSEQVFLILHGDGSNGKSELLWVLEQLLGDYLRSANVDTFMDDKPQGGHNEDIARLRGARLVTTSETEKTRRLAEGLVKRLTGGDVITASYKHERTFEFTPRFKVWLAANHKPNISGTDFGIWRRILLVPFGAKFVKPGVDLEENYFRIDPNLRRDLSGEMAGILNWAIDGFRKWRDQGLNPPTIVRAVTEDYRIESDKLGAFLIEEMVQNDSHSATLNAAYQAYRTWAENGGMKPSSIRGFASDLRTRGIEVRKYGVRNDVSVIGYALLAKD
jgi:putative DNA primase/helicase